MRRRRRSTSTASSTAAHADRCGRASRTATRPRPTPGTRVPLASRSSSTATSSARVVARARLGAHCVDRNLAPVTLTGVVAGAHRPARRRRARRARPTARTATARRARAPTVRIAAYVAPRLGLAIAAGGAGRPRLAWGIVSALGPSSNLESGALQRAVAWVVVGDGRRRRGRGGGGGCGRRRVRRRAAPARAPSVGGAGCGARPRGRGGRSPSAGSTAMAASARSASSRVGATCWRWGSRCSRCWRRRPLLALIIAIVNPRLRLSGARLRRTLRLGWRRVVIDTAPLVAVIVSVALAIGCFTTASALASGSDRQLADKAAVYVGTDLAIDVFDPVDVPPDWEPRTTVISKVSVRADGDRAELVGVDRSRFADVATLRSDGVSQSLGQTDGGDRSGAGRAAVAGDLDWRRSGAGRCRRRLDPRHDRPATGRGRRIGAFLPRQARAGADAGPRPATHCRAWRGSRGKRCSFAIRPMMRYRRSATAACAQV